VHSSWRLTTMPCRYMVGEQWHTYYRIRQNGKRFFGHRSVRVAHNSETVPTSKGVVYPGALKHRRVLLLLSCRTCRTQVEIWDRAPYSARQHSVPNLLTHRGTCFCHVYFFSAELLPPHWTTRLLTTAFVSRWRLALNQFFQSSP
jgi:hypothetical protein